MSTITPVGAGVVATGNNASLAPSIHASTQPGDMVLLFASIRNSGTGTVNTPTGYSPILSFGNMALFGRVFVSGDTAPTVTFAGGVANADTLAHTATFRGVSPEVLTQLAITPATQLNGAATNVAYPGLTVAKDRHAVFLLGWMQDDFSAASTPGGMTAVGSPATSTAGDDAGSFWRFVVQTTAANISSGSITITGGTSVISRAAVVALKPAATVTVDEQDVYPPRVLVSVTDLTIGDAVAIYRSVGGVRTLVHGASSSAVTDPSFLRIDAELPFGVPVSYVVDVNGVEYTTSAATYTLPGGKVVISDAISGLSAEVIIGAWPEKSYDRQSTVYRAGGRNVVVSGDFGGFEGDIELYTDAWSSTENLREVLDNATQGIVLIRQPGGYDGVDCHVVVTSYRERRYSQDGSDPKRLHVLHVVEVDGWASAFQALGFTYADLADAYTGLTYANLAADFPTYLALAQADLS